MYGRNEIDIITGSISKDHVRLSISMPPSISVSILCIRSRETSYGLLSEFEELKSILRVTAHGKGTLRGIIGQCDGIGTQAPPPGRGQRAQVVRGWFERSFELAAH